MSTKKLYTLIVLVVIAITLMAYYFYQRPDRSKEAIEMRTAADGLMKSDPDAAFTLLREAIVKESSPSVQRGLTAAYIADVFTTKTSRSPVFAKRYIFVGGPFASFLDNAITDEDNRVADGIRRIYEYSLQFSPLLPVSSFRLAEWYGNRALEGGEMAEAHRMKAKDYTAKAEEALARIGKTARVPEQIAYAYWLKGVVLGQLIEAEGGGAELETRAEGAFKQAIQILTGSNVLPKEGEVQYLWARLNYATFLDKRFGDARKDDIGALLADIMRSPSRPQLGFTRYLGYLGKTEAAFYDMKRDKENIASLAAYNADFAAMLKDLGWKF
jgi:hypothetical protein